MNHNITLTSPLAPLIPSLAAIVAKRGGPVADKFELEDTVLRCGGYAWDIGAEAAPLHAEIASFVAVKKDADDTAAAFAAANPPPPPRKHSAAYDAFLAGLAKSLEMKAADIETALREGPFYL